MMLEDKYAALWHAFNALDKPQKASVVKRQLKVLTHNITNCMGIINVGDTLNDCYESESITFLEYISFLKTNLMSRVTEADSANANISMEKIDEVCWLLCSPGYAVVVKENDVVKANRIDTDDAFRMWRVFNFFAEVEEDTGMPLQPVAVHSDEIGIFLHKFCSIVVQKFDQDEFKRISLDIPLFSFVQFLHLMERDYCANVDHGTITAAIKELYEEHISEVIMKAMLSKHPVQELNSTYSATILKNLPSKELTTLYEGGYLAKKGHRMMTWKDRWFVLKPGVLQYYTSVERKDIKGEMAITSTCRAEPLPDKAGAKPYRFTLMIAGRIIELSAPSFATRSDWLGAIRDAWEHHKNNTSPNKHRRDKRRKERQEQWCREEQQRKEALETRKAQEEAEEKRQRTQKELDELKKAQEEAEEMRQRTQKELDELKKRNEAAEARMREYEEQQRQEAAKLEQARQEMENYQQSLLDRENEMEKAQNLHRLDQDKMEKFRKDLEDIQKEKAKVQDELDAEAALRKEEQERLAELQEMHAQLEQRFAEERQAKEDEEKVRNLQGKYLQEEFQKREELEKLQAVLEDELTQERYKARAERSKQNERLKEAATRLAEVEAKRRETDAHLQEAQEKKAAAECAKLELEEKLKAKERSPGAKVAIFLEKLSQFQSLNVGHRGKGFMPERDMAAYTVTSEAELPLSPTERETHQFPEAVNGGQPQQDDDTSDGVDDDEYGEQTDERQGRPTCHQAAENGQDDTDGLGAVEETTTGSAEETMAREPVIQAGEKRTPDAASNNIDQDPSEEGSQSSSTEHAT